MRSSAAQDLVEPGAADRRARSRRGDEHGLAQRAAIDAAGREIAGRLADVAAAPAGAGAMRVAEVPQQDGTPAFAARRVRGDRRERIPALAREVLGGALDVVRAALADGAQAQRPARLVDAPGLELDRADPLGDRDERPRALAQPAERDGEAAVGVGVPGDQREQAVDVVAAHLRLPDEVRHEAAVGGRVEQDAASGPAVAPGAAGLLVVALERGGQRPVPDRAHVGLVDAHPEGRRRHHDGVAGSP